MQPSDTQSSKPTIVFAGGGSGGHISPGLAIAERVQLAQPDTACVFACSTRPIDALMLDHSPFAYQTFDAAPLIARPLSLLRFVTQYVRTRHDARRFLKEVGATHLVAVGGFVAAPIASAGRSIGLTCTLVNLDNPPGKANKLIARTCDRVLTAIDVTQPRKFADRIVGHPVRLTSIARDTPDTCRSSFDLDPNLPTLLVTGASQGASTINEMMIALAQSHADSLGDWQILHLTGEHDAARVAQAYKRAGVRSTVTPFTHAMGMAWGAATVAISRAGANSVAEAALNAVPAIFLPYPYHRDAHQRNNAMPLEACGGAIILEDEVNADENAASVSRMLLRLIQDNSAIERMRAALKATPFPDGAEQIARIILDAGN